VRTRKCNRGAVPQLSVPGSDPLSESFLQKEESKAAMKAIQVEQVGGPEAMELVELPVPQPKANEAVVKLAASGVNFIDVYFREAGTKRRCRLFWGRKAQAW